MSAEYDGAQLAAASEGLLRALRAGHVDGVNRWGDAYIKAFVSRPDGIEALLAFLTCHVAEQTKKTADLERRVAHIEGLMR
jgi:hypothetical protein